MNEWPKACSCGAKYYAGEWTLLSFVGYMTDEVERLELRNCTCGSTLAVEIEREGLPWTLAGDLASVCRIEAERANGILDPYAWPPSAGVTKFVALEDLEQAKHLDAIADALMKRVCAFNREPEAA